ncbi:ABC transporter substrate-binding protein [Paenibacillus oceani]|uniref:Extracellular solute-binding protein n=1 Tax=Paenibacillus oceani TaxID=2772510 RepID=A0A927C953_9BACL|nr:extracellular solute-binding protein [Paenibacillus oceani]MBD2862362.1 extracellular solute-binding protein [Paenibacillus oceani]
MKMKTFLSLSGIGVLLLTGCSQTVSEQGEPGEQPQPPQAKAEPVTLQVASQGSSTVLDEEFKNVVQSFLAKKYPHITLNYNPEGAGTSLDALMAAGTIPDLIVTFNGNLASYKEKELVSDMTPLFQTSNIDLNRFEPGYITDVKNASDKGEIYGLPINVNYHAMYYNKDIFDKFGAPYPTDGMSWEQLIDLAKKVTRLEGGTQFRGLDPGSTVIWMSQPLSIAAIDPRTDKATVRNDNWNRVFKLAKSIYEIPGNGLITATPKDQFMKSKTLAVLLDLNILTPLSAAGKDGLNWDIAQYPSYTEKPNTYGNASVYVMVATKTGKHRDDAVKAIELITSEEVQLALSKKGRLSPLKSDQVKQALGADNPDLKSKRLPSIFKSTPVAYPVASPYRGKAEGILVNKFREYVNGSMDENTALAQAEEEINKLVATEKNK